MAREAAWRWCYLPAIASSFSLDSTTSRVGSIRTAPSRSKPFSSWFTRCREAPSKLRQIFLRQLQADADLLALRDAVAARQQQDLLGQARRQRAGVEVLDGVEHQAQAPAVQPQQRFVQFGVPGQQFLEVGLAHDQQRGLAVGVGSRGCGAGRRRARCRRTRCPARRR